MEIHFLKTEWSDIIILEDNGHFAMIDTGMADQFPQIMDFLKSRGAEKLDFILLTHFHRDHYGSIPALLGAFPVDKVIMKEYSGLDRTTAWGTLADDAYRADEMLKYHAMQELVRQKSCLIQAEEIEHVDFMGHRLALYNTANSIRTIYEDAAYPETYHQYTCSENQNSLAIWMEAEGVNVFFGGDMLDAPAVHPLANYVNTRIARGAGRQADLYKAPHHGTIHTAAPDALAVYQPKYVVITNGEEYLREHSDVFSLLAPYQPKIYLTECQNVSVTLCDGKVVVREGDLLPGNASHDSQI